MWRPGAQILLLCAISAFAQERQPSRGVNVYRFEKEAALGRGLADDFRRQVTSIDDRNLHAYVSKVVTRLNEFTESPFPLTIEIFSAADAKLGPAGLPGGYLFIPLNLLAGAQDETGFGRQVAHAIAHIAMTRQATRPANREEILNLATVPLIYVGGWTHGHATASATIPLGFRKFHEQFEAQADLLVAEWVAQSWLADKTFDSGEFAAMSERARILAVPEKRKPPPSLRKRP